MKSTSRPLLLVLSLLTTPLAASELWITPAVDPPETELGNWATTSTGRTHFSFAVPDDFEDFVSAKVVAIGKNDKDTTFDLALSISENTLRHDAFTDAVAGMPVTFYRDVLMEVDVSSIIPALSGGTDYVSLYFNTNFARVVGLRFQYQNADLGSLREDLDQETTQRMAGDENLQANIDAEAAARTVRDDELQTQFDGEVAARESGDAALQGAISAEEAARIAGDATVQANLDAEAASRMLADDSLQSQVHAEVTARQAGDELEAQDRAAADSTLALALVDESELRLFGDIALQSALNDEIDDRTAGDAAIESQLVTSCAPKTFYLSSTKHAGPEVRNACAAGYHVATSEELARILNMDYMNGMGEPAGVALGNEGTDTQGWFYSSVMALDEYIVFGEEPTGEIYGNCWEFGEPGGVEDPPLAGTGLILEFYSQIDYAYQGGSMPAYPYLFVVEYGDCTAPYKVWCASD